MVDVLSVVVKGGDELEFHGFIDGVGHCWFLGKGVCFMEKGVWEFNWCNWLNGCHRLNGCYGLNMV
jgi:hypothetical protein